jgi:hypothetical protein
MMSLRELKNLDSDKALAMFGLQRRGSNGWLGAALGGLALGALVGAAVAFFAASDSPESSQDKLSRRPERLKLDVEGAVGPHRHFTPAEDRA